MEAGRSLKRDVAALLALSLAPAIGLGLARFAYALVLPDMRRDLGWSFAEAGSMNTINAAGYLAGALVSSRMIRAVGGFRSVMIGSLFCILGLALSGLTADFTLLSVSRLMAGIGAAFAFIAGGTLAAEISHHHQDRASFLLNLFYIGPGIGVIVSGVAVPGVFDRLGPGTWRLAWDLLAILALAMTAIIAGAGRVSVSLSGRSATHAPLLPMSLLLVGYFGFGAGYIAYMTFMIAWVQTHGAGPIQQAVFWSIIGLGTILSPWLWSRLMAALKGGGAVGAMTAVTFLGALLPLLGHALPILLASAFIFGSAFLAVVAGTTAFVRRNYPRSAWPGAIAAVTISFGVGQTFGPLAIGWITDRVGSLDTGLWCSAACLLAGAVISALQKDLSFEP